MSLGEIPQKLSSRTYVVSSSKHYTTPVAVSQLLTEDNSICCVRLLIYIIFEPKTNGKYVLFHLNLYFTWNYISLEIIFRLKLYFTWYYISLEIIFHLKLYFTLNYISLEIIFHLKLYFTWNYISLEIIFHSNLYFTRTYISLELIFQSPTFYSKLYTCNAYCNSIYSNKLEQDNIFIYSGLQWIVQRKNSA